jgi:hypothetical protein
MYSYKAVSRRLVTGLTVLAAAATVALALAVAASPAASAAPASRAHAIPAASAMHTHQVIQSSARHVTRIAHPVTPLPGCAETFAPRVGDNAGRKCLVRLSASAMQAAAANPDELGCSVDYYQNGPYGSAQQKQGWAVCVRGSGNFAVPLQFNDQASSWDSCAAGVFFVNGINTTPDASFPGNDFGNFPWGHVPNDSLSSLKVGANNCG